MKHWINTNYRTLIVLAFMIPIIIVAIVSISHVTQWYGVSNPLTWAVYLSVGVEIAAMSAVAALSANVGRNIYIPFIIVTLIQFMGNVFFSYEFINIDAESFRSWVELVSPIFQFAGVEATNLIAHKRILALLAGGMLPVISLTFLHMLVRFTEEQRLKEVEEEAEKTNNDTAENTKNPTPEYQEFKKENPETVTANITLEDYEKIKDLIDNSRIEPDEEKMRQFEEERLMPTPEELEEMQQRLTNFPPVTKEEIFKGEPILKNTEGLKDYIEKVLDHDEDVEHEDVLDEELVKPTRTTKPEIQEESWDNIRDEVLNEPTEKNSESTTEKDSNPTEEEKKNL